MNQVAVIKLKRPLTCQESHTHALLRVVSMAIPGQERTTPQDQYNVGDWISGLVCGPEQLMRSMLRWTLDS
jgi:hypothetical protein